MKKFISQNSLLLFILAVAIGIRLWKIDWGLPELYEEATPLTVAWKFWNCGQPGFDFNPHFFNYPALTFYVQFLAQVIHYLIGAMVGAYTNLGSFGTTLPPLVIVARLVDVLFDVGTIVVLYILTREIADRRAALLAAALVALSPLHIRYAHLIQVDTPLTFFSMLALLFIVRVYTSGLTKWYLLSGVAIALATASKYTGAFLLVVLVAAHAFRSNTVQTAIQSLEHPTLIKSLIVAVVVFLILNPFIIFNFSEFQNDFGFEQYHVSYGHLGLDPSESTIGFYLLNVLPSALGWLFCLILIATIVHIIIKGDKLDLLLLVFPIVYLFILSTWEMRADRYLLPIVPMLILVGSIGAVRGWDRFVKGSDVRMDQVLVVVGLVLVLQPAYGGFRYLRTLGLPDTRALTKQWISNNVPAGSAIATGPYGVDYPDTTYAILHIPFIAVEAERTAPFYDTRWYEDFDLLIASDYDYGRYLREPDRYRGILAYYDSLRSRWSLIYEAVPSEGQSGPALWLYQYPDSLKRPTFDPTLFERLQANPESARISNFLKDLNTILYRKGKLEKCVQIQKEILSVEVEDLPLRNQLAQILFDLGRYDEALKQMLISVKANQNQAEIFALAGRALLRLKHYREAEPTLFKAISLNKSLESPYEDLASLYTLQKDESKLRSILAMYRNMLPPQSEKAKSVRERLQKLQVR